MSAYSVARGVCAAVGLVVIVGTVAGTVYYKRNSANYRALAAAARNGSLKPSKPE